MPKKSVRPTTVKSRFIDLRDDDPQKYFELFLAAADRVALELMIHGGILVDSRADSEFYDDALTRLAQEFMGEFKHGHDVDDHCHYEEHWAKLDAAHMVGLALGLRLRRADLALTGGSK